MDREKSESTFAVEDTGIRVRAGQAGITLDDEALTALIVARIQAMDYSVLKYTPEKDDPAPLDLQAIYNEIHTEARDAYYTDELEVVPEEVGKSFEISEAELLIGQSPGQEVFIPFTVTEPEITARYLEEALFRDTLSSTYTILTNPGLINRTSNVKLAAQFVNGTVLMPDEVFSFNEVVGERTEARGFKEAKVFVKNEIVDGIGGGICQISSTLYKASLFADLQIVERTNHSFTVDYTQLGEDATVYYGAVDYKFKNNTPFPLKSSAGLKAPMFMLQ